MLLVDVYTICSKFKGGIDMEIHDTSALKNFELLRTLVYPGTHCVIMCYDVVYPPSLNNIRQFWRSETEKVLPNVPYILCGNKLDLKDTNPNTYLSDEEVFERTRNIKNIKARLKCSALMEVNKDEAFVGLVKHVFTRAKEEAIEYEEYEPRSGVTCCRLF